MSGRWRRRFRPGLPALLALVLLAACGPDASGPEPRATTPAAADDPPAVAELDRLAEEIDRRLGMLQPVSGTWELGSTRSRFTAFFDGDQVAYLEELREEGEVGRSLHRHWLEEGRLFRYFESEPGRAAGGGPQPVRIRLYFAADGEIIAAHHTVGGTPRELTEFVEPVVRSHVRELIAAARRQRTEAAGSGNVVQDPP